MTPDMYVGTLGYGPLIDRGIQGYAQDRLPERRLPLTDDKGLYEPINPTLLRQHVGEIAIFMKVAFITGGVFTLEPSGTMSVTKQVIRTAYNKSND